MKSAKRVAIIVLIIGFCFILIPETGRAEQWETDVSKDEMTGEENWYATSPAVGPTKRMGFPYSDLEAWLIIGHDGADDWAYIWFTTAPNLKDTETKDGYNLINTRIKWDDEIENIQLTQEWGSKFIYFRDGKSVISNIKKSDTVLLELNWYGQGKVYFRFPLEGSVDAINKIHSAFGD